MTGRAGALCALTLSLFVAATSAVEAETLTIEWDAPTDSITAGYVVWYGTAQGVYTQSINVGFVTSYSVPTLAAATTYYFVVQAYNAGGELSPQSLEVSGTTAGGDGGSVLSPPAALTAAARDDRSVNLTWQNANSVSTGVQVEVGSATGLADVRSLTTGVTTSFTIGELPVGTYFVRVRIINGSVISAPSNEVVVSVRDALLTPPSSLTATVRDDRSVALTWQNTNTTSTGARIEIGSATGLKDVRELTTGLTTSFTVGALPVGTYFIRVRIINGTVISAPSDEVVVSVRDTLLTPPSLLTATVRDDRSVALAWQNTNTASTGVRVEVGSATGLKDVRELMTGVITSFTVDALPVGTYFIRVRIINGTVISAPSNEVVVSVRDVLPTPPSSLTATVRDDRSVALSWQNTNPTSTGARIEIGSATGLKDVRELTTGVTTSFTVGALPVGTYFMRVRIINGSLIGAPSNEVVVSVRDDLLTPPSSLTATVRDDGSVDLTWQNTSIVSNAVRIEVGSAIGLADVRDARTGVTTSFTVSSLPAGTYFVRVRAIKGSTVSAPSNEVVVSVRAATGGVLTPPSSLTAKVRQQRFIDLKWQNRGNGISGVRVEIGAATGLTDVAALTTGVTTNFTVGDLPARTYFIRLRGIKGDSLSAPSNEVVVTLGAGADAPLALNASVTGDVVSLDWEPPTEADGVIGYQIEAGTGPGRSDLAHLRVPDVTFTAYSLHPGHYFVRVRAITAAGVGSSSNEVVVTVGPRAYCTEAPGTPNLTTGLAGNSLLIRWSPGSGDAPTGYVLDLLPPSGGTAIATAQFGLHQRTLNANIPNGTYLLRLTAINSCGATPWPAESALSVGSQAPAVPASPGEPAAIITGNSVTLNWTPPLGGSAPTRYLLEAIDADDKVLLTVDTGNALTTFVHSAVPAGDYRVRVRGANDAGVGLPSTAVTIRVGP